MSLYVLDTDTLSLLQRSHPQVSARVASRLQNEIAITIITVEEQLRGWFTYLRRAKNATQTAAAYNRLRASVAYLARANVLPYSEAAIDRFRSLLKARTGVRADDLRIAAICLEFGATVVTRNVTDFRVVPDLQVEDWSQQD